VKKKINSDREIKKAVLFMIIGLVLIIIVGKQFKLESAIVYSISFVVILLLSLLLSLKLWIGDFRMLKIKTKERKK